MAEECRSFVNIHGCQNAFPNDFRSSVNLNGFYEEVDHQQGIFKKKDEEIHIYWWDAKDGADYNGWWIGPDVGGNLVYAFHPDAAAKHPPRRGWKVPAIGGEIDWGMVVDYHQPGTFVRNKRRGDGSNRTRPKRKKYF